MASPPGPPPRAHKIRIKTLIEDNERLQAQVTVMVEEITRLRGEINCKTPIREDDRENEEKQ